MHELPHGIAVIGLEAGPLSQWLHKGLTDAGFETVLMETRQVKAALKAMPIKTDRRDAEGIARLLQMGWFRPVHCKTVSSQEMRALLTSRKSILDALLKMECSLRGVLRNFGLKLGPVSKVRYEARVRELIAGNAMLEAAAEPILRARADLRRELAGLEKILRNLVRQDPVCRLLMTMPGVGPVVALTFMSAIDDPERFRRSKDVGPWAGLTPGRNQSGERDRRCDHQARRRRSAHGALSGCHGDAVPRGTELAEGLGATSDEAPRQEARNRCLGPAHRRGASPHVAGRHGVPLHAQGRRWRFGRYRRGCIPPAVSKERRKEPRLKVAIHRCPLAGARFPMMRVVGLVCRTALLRSSTPLRLALGNRLGPGITLAAAAPTTDGSESLATDTSGIVIPSQGRKGLKSRNLESEPGWPPGS